MRATELTCGQSVNTTINDPQKNRKKSVIDETYISPQIQPPLIQGKNDLTNSVIQLKNRANTMISIDLILLSPKKKVPNNNNNNLYILYKYIYLISL